ncbi:hypothetical protein [Bacillus cereus]|uniref:hypothetical protein n=1 Tax=Bacillus cereus TaxID=1396 RepID=UPI0028524B98|nr:hypothetical protein [Bacillus cereus]
MICTYWPNPEAENACQKHIKILERKWISNVNIVTFGKQKQTVFLMDIGVI